MPAGPHPADSLNHFQPDLGIPYDSISSGSALEQALNDFRSSLRLNPDNQEVASAIQFLKKLMEIK
jgi:hypothetical protein